jgi:5'(3')-deoxyribonucleotidase
MIKKIIAIDMDNVMADIETHLINCYERDFGVRVERAAMQGIPESEAFPDKKAVWNYVLSPGFFRTVPVMEGAIEAVKKLTEKYEIYVVSAAMEFPQSLIEKHDWLQEHFPFISWRNIVLCGDKSVIASDYLIDDHCKNLDFCKGVPLLFSASHNSNITKHIRLNNWSEVLNYFFDKDI